MQPQKSILDRSFRYVNSAHTNIRQTFAKVRFQQEQERRQREAETMNNQPLRVIK